MREELCGVHDKWFNYSLLTVRVRTKRLTKTLTLKTKNKHQNQQVQCITKKEKTEKQINQQF